MCVCVGTLVTKTRSGLRHATKGGKPARYKYIYTGSWYTWVSFCHLMAARKAIRVCITHLSIPMFSWFFLKTSSHVFLGLPTVTLSYTLKYLKHLTQSLSSFFSTKSNQYNLPVLITSLMLSIPSLLLNSSQKDMNINLKRCLKDIKKFSFPNKSVDIWSVQAKHIHESKTKWDESRYGDKTTQA